MRGTSLTVAGPVRDRAPAALRNRRRRSCREPPRRDWTDRRGLVSPLEIDNAILEAGSADYLDLWYITQIAEDVLGTDDPSEVRRAALESVQRLLKSGQLRAGRVVAPGEFVASGEDADAAFERINTEVRNLDRELRVGDVAWFEVPERGEN